MNKYLRVYFIPGMLILALSIAFLFFVKNRVFELSRNIKSVNNQIILERENIHVLKAEYSYLTNPKRLKNLADKYLNLRSPSSNQTLELDKVQSYFDQHLETNHIKDLTNSDTKIQTDELEDVN